MMNGICPHFDSPAARIDWISTNAFRGILSSEHGSKVRIGASSPALNKIRVEEAVYERARHKAARTGSRRRIFRSWTRLGPRGRRVARGRRAASRKEPRTKTGP